MRDACALLVAETAGVGESFIVYGNATDFQLVPVRSVPDRDAIAANYAKGMPFCGVLANVEGQTKVAVRHDGGFDHLEAMRHAGVSFICQRVGDSIEWLDRLWSLPDRRIAEDDNVRTH